VILVFPFFSLFRSVAGYEQLNEQVINLELLLQRRAVSGRHFPKVDGKAGGVHDGGTRTRTTTSTGGGGSGVGESRAAPGTRGAVTSEDNRESEPLTAPVTPGIPGSNIDDIPFETSAAAAGSSSDGGSGKDEDSRDFHAYTSCPSLLYGSWLRLETDPAPPARASKTQADDINDPAWRTASVLLRFTVDSVERHEMLLPTGNKDGHPLPSPPRRHRTRHQSWPGVLSVECNWSEEDEAAAAEAMQEQSAHSSTGGIDELLSALRSATSLPSDVISAEIHIAFPGAAVPTAAGSTDDSNPWRRASLSPLSFAFVPVRLNGVTHATLVERWPQGASAGDTARAHGPAYLRLSSATASLR
jgi:hypothetical protein